MRGSPRSPKRIGSDIKRGDATKRSLPPPNTRPGNLPPMTRTLLPLILVVAGLTAAPAAAEPGQPFDMAIKVWPKQGEGKYGRSAYRSGPCDVTTTEDTAS